MSKAGIHSNRGDMYQKLVAFDWALTILIKPEYEWIEVDSVKYEVDDVVVGKADGTLICCQCKKNQPNHNAWKVADLAKKELGKASRLLAREEKAKVYFYSRSPFGDLAKLREHSTTQADEASYQASLGQEQQKIDKQLASAIEASALSTYDFLRRTTFKPTDEFNDMEARLRERLRFTVSNPEAAYDALWTRLDKLGGRMEGGNISASSQHRLTKEDLEAVLREAGAMLSPDIDSVKVRKSFADTSAIGRSWRQDIAGEYIPCRVLNDLLSAIDAGKQAILLTGLPGSGKTCVMLALQKALEQRAQSCRHMVPLFIESREYVDLATTQDLHNLGLPEKWVEKAARLADEVPVVVVIDSLDVLSNAREHRALNYFLAQIDRLLRIPNITVVAACRDFDRRYDRQIAQRQWDYETKCPPLDWESEVAPLLDKLGIDKTTINADTHELIRNPRELALFVELAQRRGSFNVATSQALTQKYLEVFVRDDKALGEVAMKGIEAMAHEMLRSRKLEVPDQRFTASSDIRRRLLSLNVLQETQGGKLTFGHQTLLDVLVISGTLRKGNTLNQFIQGLLPVPFVRPSIRSFVVCLAAGDRQEFRKQLRAVLIGSAAFHIRRLVAESFAEMTPQDQDWPMIRELRNKHPDVFQIIYRAPQIEWHHFWLKHLVPDLKVAGDAEGMMRHVHRIWRWQNNDPKGVLEFWTEALQLDWMDNNQITDRLGSYLSEIDTKHLALAVPLIEQLLDMPRQESSPLEHSIARCVSVGVMQDDSLWRYIAGEIKEEDITSYQFIIKLHCESHRLGNFDGNFLRERMRKSTVLLDLALASVEGWSRIRSSRYRNSANSFLLPHTSYGDAHSQDDILVHPKSLNILLYAMEIAIINHANMHSEWWQKNRERLSFSHEGALCYFAIQACTHNPDANVDLIGHMLSDKDMLASNLYYELGTLINKGFIYLDGSAQDTVMKCILTLREDHITDTDVPSWILELLVAIPCYLRSPEAQDLVDNYEQSHGVLTRQPPIHSYGGMVSPPFAVEVFGRLNDAEVVRLLRHYGGYEAWFNGLVGGETSVCGQLGGASSRDPARFLRLLSTHWADLATKSRDAIMHGAANYLAYRYGDLQPGDNWKPIDDPDAIDLADHILDELEKYPSHWHHSRAASEAIQACAYVIEDMQNAARLVSLATGFENLQEESIDGENSINLVDAGLNMIGGGPIEALMILANRFQELNLPFPESLLPTLRRFTGNGHPALRALILRRLPYLQSLNPDLGWDLFYCAMWDAVGLWQYAERCLYRTCHSDFKRVNPLLKRIYNKGDGKDLETWGRISALSVLWNHIDILTLLNDLKTMDSNDAWRGAARVWTHPENFRQRREKCLRGLEAGLKANDYHAVAVAGEMEQLFRQTEPMIPLPVELIRLFFAVSEGSSKGTIHFLGDFGKWLNAISQQDPAQALTMTEIYLDYVNLSQVYIYDYSNEFSQIMTCLFREAEEKEESDGGEMLRRTVSLQDMLLLKLEVEDHINKWLKNAERP